VLLKSKSSPKDAEKTKITDFLREFIRNIGRLKYNIFEGYRHKKSRPVGLLKDTKKERSLTPILRGVAAYSIVIGIAVKVVPQCRFKWVLVSLSVSK
tara:strand:+ start:228 stop:518 length:291 start_codon:yes stop_codon:yes gene_type:complete